MIEEILNEWAYRIDSGLPNPKNPQHIRELAEVLDEMGLSSIKNELIQNLMEAGEDKNFKNPTLNKVIKYTDKNGKEKEGKVGNLLRNPEDSPGRIEAEKLLPKDGTPERDAINNELGGEGQPNRDIEKEKEKKGGEEEQASQPETGTSINPSNDAGKNYLQSQSDSDPAKQQAVKQGIIPDKEVEKSKTDTGEFKKLSAATLNSKKNQLADARERIDGGEYDDNTKEAFNVFEDNFNKLFNAETNEERLDAIRTLSDYGFLARNGNGKKIYISNLPLPSKQMTGDSGDAFGELVNKLAEDNEIDIPLRDESADSALADVSGKHNEAGVVYLLDPSESNKNDYDNFRDQYESYGGDEKLANQQNEAAVVEINKEIQKRFPNGKVKKATQVGGIGPEKLKQLGIDPKKDPTDVLIEVEKEDGTTEYMKVSMKVYSDPKNITMKNSGLGNAGSHYLGDSQIDDQLKSLREKHNYLEKGISPEDVNKRKREFREAYLTLFSTKMDELSKTDEGQAKLMEMWKEVHGCGNDVYTSVTNKKTGKTEVHPPEHYCEPETPFKVEYDGVKVVIRMGGEKDNSFLELVCKTESTGSPKLLFNHKKKKTK
jgi:hypothetical protein